MKHSRSFLLLLSCVVLMMRGAHAEIAIFNTPIPSLASPLRAALNDGVQSAEKATDLKERDYALGALARAFAKIGDFPMALSLANRLGSASLRASVLGGIGRTQANFGRDEKGAGATFEAAQTAVLAIKTGASDRNFALGSLARTRAETSDFDGAAKTAALISGFGGTDTLERIARIAAREGELKPVKAFAQSAPEDKKSIAARWLYVASLYVHDSAGAEKALSQVTDVQDKIACLFALQKSYDDEKDPRGLALLDQALELVPKVKSDDEIDMSEVVRDADFAYIARCQLEAGRFDQALVTLGKIASPDSEFSIYVEFASVLTRKKQLQKALDLGDPLPLGLRAATLGAIIRDQNRNVRFADEKDKAALKNNLEIIVNGTLGLLQDGDAKDSDVNWAKVSVVTGLARGDDFKRAGELAHSIALPRQKANAFAGIARAALENKNVVLASSQLDKMRDAAHEVEAPQECAQIIAQSVISICDPLLEDEESGLGDIFGGLS